MARGWESKAVEDMVEAKAAEREIAARARETPEMLERRRRREGLLLSRAKVTAELAVAREERYRAMLERSLAYVDAELEMLDQPEPASDVDPSSSTRTS